MTEQEKNRQRAQAEERRKQHLAKAIREDFERRREERRAVESGWLLNMRFFSGEQYCDVSPRGGLEEEEKRFTFYADLCRKYHFALFKLDGVCGVLRAEKASVFADLLRECRKYSPDLIVLNHRLNLYEAEPHVTTFLWQGAETYVDVHSANGNTGSHHRCFIFDRGLPDDLERLAEDHGVCISSCPDYFDDDLIYQAFGRCMILSPEIYGNPWFLRDDEYARLAYIFNLHKLAAPILVNGLKLPESMGVTQDANGNPIPGANPVSRGTDSHRFIVTGNNTWNTT